MNKEINKWNKTPQKGNNEHPKLANKLNNIMPHEEHHQSATSIIKVESKRTAMEALETTSEGATNVHLNI